MTALASSPAQYLKDECDAARSLLDLLRREQSCLANADADGLAGLTEDKAALAAQMTKLAQRRYSMLAQAGYEAGESGMQAWLESAPDGGAWDELIALAQQAKELNRVNGLLITQHMARNQSALNVLQGNPQGGNFYGPDGRSATRVSSGRVVVG